MRIACVHQGFELYGSDRSFVESVAALRAGWPAARIEVVLPRPGPIVAPLKELASAITFEPLWVLRRKELARLATLGLLALPPAVLRAARRFRANDLVYVNTTVVTDHLVAARLFPGKALVHVHEIPEGAALPVLRALLRWSEAEIIFNSCASRDAFALGRSPRHRVVYNGVAVPGGVNDSGYDGSRPLRLLMLGRISRIKGQEVLIQSVGGLAPELKRRVRLRIAGSAFEDLSRESALRALVGRLGLAETVRIEPFTPDPAPLFRWADVVAVPSRRPESLGRVAIEAMGFSRPPLASAIGGLGEVVRDGETGWLVPPGRADLLRERLGEIIAHPAAWAGFGRQARARYEALFSERAAAAAIQGVVEDLLQRRGARAPAGALAGELLR